MSNKTENIKTLTNAKLYQLLQALSSLIVKDTPMSASIKLRKTLKSVRSVLETLDESRQAKVNHFTTKDSDGKDVVDESGFANEMEILLKETSDVEIVSVSTSEFPVDFPITTADLDILLETSILTE